jgi:hypothetical protein
MLELSKTILSKISFDQYLFKKELKKARKWVKPNEALVLKVWCLAQFGHLYKDVILEVFDAK